MSYKIGIPFFIILFILSFIFLIRGCNSLFDLNYLKGKQQLYYVNGKDAIIGLKIYEQCISYESSGGFTKKSVKIHYYLRATDVETGKLILEKKINTKSKRLTVKFLGGNKNIWIFENNKFVIYNPENMEIIANNDKICEINPFLSGKLPEDIRFIKFNEEKMSVEITAKDGLFYDIDCSNFKATEKKDIKSENSKLIDQLNNLLTDERDHNKRKVYHDKINKLRRLNDIYEKNLDKIEKIENLLNEGINNKIIVHYAFDNDNVYALLKDTDSGKRNIYINFSSVSGNNRCQLYKSVIDKEYLKDNNYLVISDNWNSLNNDIYINGGFIINPVTLEPIKSGNPSSFFILHRKDIENKSPLILTRVDFNGKKIWENILPVNQIGQLLITETKLIILINDGKKVTSKDQYNIILLIDIKTGEYQKIDLF